MQPREQTTIQLYLLHFIQFMHSTLEFLSLSPVLDVIYRLRAGVKGARHSSSLHEICLSESWP